MSSKFIVVDTNHHFNVFDHRLLGILELAVSLEAVALILHEHQLGSLVT